ncbi:MAG TPA: histidine ammonia-lyase [Candidatus Dormibacteraeota bacterium]|nr:histidine ammonia-lyase [Candidatus Dormibacteraeota bacterium]
MSITLDGQSLQVADVVAVARHGERVSLGPQARTRLKTARDLVDRLVAEDRVVYGLTTGVGALKNVRIPPADTRQLQRNLLMSHAVGVGPPLPDDVVRAAMLVRVNQFCQGSSGVSPQVAERLVDLLNHDICPFVPEKGSLGASGDLAPSAHVGLVLIGDGDVLVKGERRPGGEALRAAGLQPVELQAKDALSVLNGTHFMTGAASLVLDDAHRLLLTADVVAALSVEALRGSRTAFDPRIHQARPHPGQVASAARIFALTEGSGIAESHVLCDRVQDAYSLRCAAQVHGACADAIDYLRRVLEVELNAGTDNPLVFAADEAVLSGGNFHGEPLAIALDTASIGLSELGSISERRLFRMLAGFLSELPAFLTRYSGLDSGYMLLQYTAAALVTDNQLLSMPASVHSLPTSADQEDHNSMGWHSAQRARQVAVNVETILGLEALGAAQGIDLLSPLKPGRLTGEAHAAIRKRVPTLDHDRVLEPEIQTAIELIRSGTLAKIASSVPPPLAGEGRVGAR